jgi:hypothetical protein
MSLVEASAPILFLFSQEQYYPDNPLAFIQKSRFRHHRKLGGDQGWNKNTNRFESNNSHNPAYYDIPVATINSWGLLPNGKNRRPRDDNSGHDHDVFLQPDEKRVGNRHLSEVPIYFNRLLVNNRPDFDSVVQYWFFYGYNQAPNVVGVTLSHQGDWEHLDLAFKNKRCVAAYFFNHGTPVKSELGDLETISGRIVGYVAKGTHATYPHGGNHTVDVLGPIHFTDETDKGERWDTSRNMQDLRTRPWRDFAGAWGEVGEVSASTGPLGPWFKERSWP